LLPEHQGIVKDVLESLVVKYQSRRWDALRASAPAAPVSKTRKRAATAGSHR
jgi:hypothetical protein